MKNDYFDLYAYLIGLICMIISVYIYNQIDCHNLMKNAVISNAVLTERIIGSHNYYSYNYYYHTMTGEYSGTISAYRNAAVGDTILIVYDHRKNKKNRAIRMWKGKAAIKFGEYLIVNNMTEEERKMLSDKVMRDLKDRYSVHE